MPDRYRFRDDGKQVWSGTLYADFYSSVVNTEGLAWFLKKGRSRPPAELWAYSPYWGSVSERVSDFGAKRTVLVPAMRRDRTALGLSKSDHEALDGIAEVWRNDDEKEDDRFWHMKAYWLRFANDSVRTAVGSCNFTDAGLAGENGNVEAMLIFDGDEPTWPRESDTACAKDLSESPVDEEDMPTPVPVAIVVAYDWRSGCWRWFLDAGDSQSDFRLWLPGLDAFSIARGSDKHRGGPPRERRATFKVTYTDASERKEWSGQVVEIHLDHSQRTYGRPLSASDILESWRTRVPTAEVGHRGGRADDEEDGDDAQTEVPAAFDAVNLYDLYRAMRALRTRLSELASHPQTYYALLVRRPDSVMSLARLASRDGEAPVVRYLVLRELASIVRDSDARLLDDVLLSDLDEMERGARKTTLGCLASEFGDDRAKARKILRWFEKQLAKMDRPRT